MRRLQGPLGLCAPKSKEEKEEEEEGKDRLSAVSLQPALLLQLVIRVPRRSCVSVYARRGGVSVGRHKGSAGGRRRERTETRRGQREGEGGAEEGASVAAALAMCVADRADEQAEADVARWRPLINFIIGT